MFRYHQYCQYVLTRAHTIRAQYNTFVYLWHHSPRMKILWRSSRLLHSFKAFTSSFKERNILVSSRFPPVFCLRLSPLPVPVLMISRCLGNLHSVSLQHILRFRGTTVSFKIPQIPEAYFFQTYLVHIKCRFKCYAFRCCTSNINSEVFTLILYATFLF
jgi:hypothetical protein